MQIEKLHHVCIQTESYADSLSFYRDVLEFELVVESAGFHGREFNTWLKKGDFFIELQTAKTGERLNNWSSLNAGPVHICFLVKDVRESYRKIKTKGYARFKEKNGEEVYRVKSGYLFKVKAPEGTEIEIRDEPLIG